MSSEKKIIFREKAHRLYLQNQQKLVLLRLTQPKVFPYFWTLLACLLLLAGLAWNTRVPVLCHGWGLVVENSSESDLLIISLLPAEALTQLKTEQNLVLYERGKNPKKIMTLPIQHVQPEVLSPASIRKVFELDGVLASQVQEPAAVVTAKAAAGAASADLRLYAGGSLPVEIEVGSRKVLSLVPGLRSLAGEG